MRPYRILGGLLAGAFALASGLVVAACSGESPEPVDLAVLVFGPIEANRDHLQNVDWMRLSARGEGLDEASFTRFVRREDADATLGGIPYGEVQIAVSGFRSKTDADEADTTEVLSAGVSARMLVDPSADGPLKANVLMAPSDTWISGVVAPDNRTAERNPTMVNNIRLGMTATDNGRGLVVLAGGTFLLGNPTAGQSWDAAAGLDPASFTRQVEIYDVATGQVETSPFDLRTPRAFHAAAPLPDGTVALFGGFATSTGAVEPTSSVELYNPATGEVREGISMLEARAWHTATLLPDGSGRVLLVGGAGAAAATWEIWSVDGSTPTRRNLDTARARHTATILRGLGKVLIYGGENTDGALAAAEVYDVALGGVQTLAESFPLAGGTYIPPRRTMHAAVAANGRDFVYVVGGYSDAGHADLLPLIDVFDFQQGAFKDTAGFSLLQGRAGHVAAPIGATSVLIAGGTSSPGGTSAIPSVLDTTEVIFEIFDPERRAPRVTLRAGETLPGGRLFGSATSLETGKVMLTGGAIANATGPGLNGTLSLMLYTP